MRFLIYSISLIFLILFSCTKKETTKDVGSADITIDFQSIDTSSINQNKRPFTKTEPAVQITKKSVPVNRVSRIQGDFSFASEWHYNEFVFLRESGELHCDGICDPSIDTMYDSNRNIKKHLRDTYYSIVDTTHIFKTIECDAWCYEFGGTDDIVAERYKNGTVACYTMCNVSTHCSLIFELEPHRDSCMPVIEFISIASGKKSVYTCMDGTITLDSTAWSKSTLKAIFDFKFVHTDGPEPMFWKGKICTPIVKSENDSVVNKPWNLL